MTLRAGTISLVLATAFVTAIVFAPITQAQSFTVLHNFTAGLDGANPYAGLTMDVAGNLYGTTQYGGLQTNDCFVVNGCGTVFKLARQGSGWVLRPLYQFQGIPTGDGANPLGRVIFGPDGALYGTTGYGGSGLGNCPGGQEFRCGTVFKLTPPPTPCRSFTCNWVETQVYDLLGAGDGANPSGEIAFDAAGNLYGGTVTTAYELTPAQGSWTHTILHTFTDRLDGTDVYYGVQLDTAGNVYGANELGGTGGSGVAFQLVPSGPGWTFNILYSFEEDGGGSTGMIVGPGGNLFAGASNGSGNPVVYELSPSDGGWIYSTLYTFTSFDHCCGVAGNLVMDSSGNLYGTTGGDGVEQIYGNVFRLTPSNGGWIYSDLHDFTGGSDGGLPRSNVVVDANGNLYGTASVGGVDGYGVVWEITP